MQCVNESHATHVLQCKSAPISSAAGSIQCSGGCRSVILTADFPPAVMVTISQARIQWLLQGTRAPQALAQVGHMWLWCEGRQWLL